MSEALFSRSGLSLDRLRVLVEVADAGGIARAVGDDTTRQSQYSRQLKELGQAFGVELTCRKGRSLALTPEGLRLATLTRQAIAGFSDFAADVNTSRVVYRIGSGESLLQWAVVPVLGTLKKDFQNVVFACENRRTAEVVSLLQDCALDYGLIRENAVPSSLCSKSYGVLEYRLYVPRSMMPVKTPRQSYRLLSELPMATLDREGDYTEGLANIGREQECTLNIKLTCSTLTQVCSAVLGGSFAGVLPTLARKVLPEQEFIELDIPALRSLRRPLSLCWNSRLSTIREGAQQVTDALMVGLKTFSISSGIRS